MSNSLLQEVRKFAPNVGVSTSTAIVRKQRDTIDEARAKTVEKLNSCIAYVRNGMKAANDSSIDLVFKQESNGTYKVGAKYGNRWLQNLLDDKTPVFDNVSEADLVATMKSIVKHVESGAANDDLLLIQERNANRKRRNAA